MKMIFDDASGMQTMEAMQELIRTFDGCTSCWHRVQVTRPSILASSPIPPASQFMTSHDHRMISDVKWLPIW